jgi:hypothetical protein
MAHVVLINPPWTGNYLALPNELYARARNEEAASPPTGIAMLATIAQIEGFDVVTIDLCNESVDEALAAILHEQPEVVGLTCFTDQHASTCALVSRLRQYAPEVKILVGGPHTSLLGRQFIEHIYVDVVVTLAPCDLRYHSLEQLGAWLDRLNSQAPQHVYQVPKRVVH